MAKKLTDKQKMFIKMVLTEPLCLLAVVGGIGCFIFVVCLKWGDMREVLLWLGIYIGAAFGGYRFTTRAMEKVNDNR